ncbi:MarR family winged helix-turn-helix transcriptional regulator [Sphingobium sp. ZW T5_29]|uniref:MarR family winged helix-turn-helix transcriptional regulator n=1 Tax=Sphingobium sp. ZW T5_29 TaxID=3378077 RepID=UPI003853D28C
MFKMTLAYQAQLLARITQADYLDRIRSTGVAPAQAYVLGELWLEEPLSQVELARRLEIGKATIGQTLQRLEKAGIVERRRVAADRRLAMVHLTEKGQTLREPLRIGALEQDELLLRQLGPERIAMLTDLLEQSNRLLSGSLSDASDAADTPE